MAVSIQQAATSVLLYTWQREGPCTHVVSGNMVFSQVRDYTFILRVNGNVNSISMVPRKLNHTENGYQEQAWGRRGYLVKLKITYLSISLELQEGALFSPLTTYKFLREHLEFYFREIFKFNWFWV